MLNLHWAVDDRGDKPLGEETFGLSRSINLPYFVRRDVRVVYDWKPGQPLPDLLAECFNADGNLVVSLDEWLGAWLTFPERPAPGAHVMLDAEKWNFHARLNDPAQIDAAHGLFPWLSPELAWRECCRRLVAAMVRWCRYELTGVTVGWYGQAGWHPDQLADFTDEIRGEQFVQVRSVLALVDVLQPVTYASERGDEFYPHVSTIAAFEALVLGRPIRPIISAMNFEGTRFTTLAETVSCLSAARLRGCKDVDVWHAIPGRENRDETQRWVDEVLIEAVHAVG